MHSKESYYTTDFKEAIDKLEYPNGDVFVGYFKNDEIIGSGRYSYKNGNVYEGTMEEGKPCNGFGNMIYHAAGKQFYIYNKKYF